MMVDPAGTFHVYEVAPADPAVEYCSTFPAHGAVLPLMAGGVAGTEETTSVLVPPVPHAFTAATESVQVVNAAGQSTEIALRLFGPTMVPQDALHI